MRLDGVANNRINCAKARPRRRRARQARCRRYTPGSSCGSQQPTSAGSRTPPRAGSRPLSTMARGSSRVPIRSQRGVEPVVSDGEGVGHLRGVEEVARIPVGEGGRGAHFPEGAGQVLRLWVESVEQRQRVDAFQTPCGSCPAAAARSACTPPAARIRSATACCHEPAVQFLRQAIGADQLRG